MFFALRSKENAQSSLDFSAEACIIPMQAVEQTILQILKMKKKEYICYSTLVSRWNRKLVEKFFNEPTKVVRNPYYACASPMKLYDLERVKKIENYKRFQKNLKKNRNS